MTEKEKIAQLKAESDLKQALIVNYGTKVFDQFSLNRLVYLIDNLISDAMQGKLDK